MTVPTTHNRKEYTGNGATTVFAYDFLILSASDIKVYVDGVLKTLTTDYSVSNVGNNAGGNVTFTSAPANGAKVVLLRDTTATQEVNLQEGSKLPAETTEGMWDRLHLLVQDLAERAKRAIKIPKTSSTAGVEMDLPDPGDAGNHGKALFVKADGSGLETRTILVTDIASPITAQGDLIQGGASGVPERLAVGATGAILRVSGGKWATLAPGGEGSALRIVSGVPAWSAHILLLPPAAQIPASGGAVLGRVDATSETWYELTFADAGDAECSFVLPPVAFTTVRLIWRTSATANDVKWLIEVREKADASVLGSGTVAASGSVVDTAKGTANQLNEASISVSYTPGASARLAILRVQRTPGDAADTLGADAKLLAVEVF